MNSYDIVEIPPADLPRCSSFWDVTDARLTERKAFAYRTGDEFVGGCALFVRYEGCGHFSHFSVRSDLRGQGIGGRLLDFAVGYFREIGMDTMRLHVFRENAAAIRLYARYGFKHAEDLPNKKIVMIKAL